MQGGVSLVTFVRDHYNSWLDHALPKSKIARVQSDGTVEDVEYAGDGNDFLLHREAKVWSIDASFLCLWGAMNTVGADDPPQVFYAPVAPAAGLLPVGRGAGRRVVDEPNDREEPVAIAHPNHYAVLAWLDHRTYSSDPDHGRVQLYAATLSDALETTSVIVVPHAEFFSGLSELRAVTVGTNVVLIWLDQRNARVGEYEPELWLETIWL